MSHGNTYCNNCNEVEPLDSCDGIVALNQAYHNTFPMCLKKNDPLDFVHKFVRSLSNELTLDMIDLVTMEFEGIKHYRSDSRTTVALINDLFKTNYDGETKKYMVDILNEIKTPAFQAALFNLNVQLNNNQVDYNTKVCFLLDSLFEYDALI